MEIEKNIQMPIDKMSYSGLTQLLRNPLIFKLKYILGVYDSKKSVSSMVGSAGHEALKYYYGGVTDFPVAADDIERRAEAIAYGMEYLDKQNDAYIKYGKTGSRASMLEAYTKAMNIYFEWEPTYNDIELCEERLESEIYNDNGQVYPLPAVGKPDLVEHNPDGTYDIIDHKFVKSFTAYENEDGDPYEDYVKIVQAKFLQKLLFATKKIRASKMIFREIKYSVNKDGSQQIRDYVVPLDHEPYDIIFTNLYNDAIKFIANPNSVYLPNLSDNFDGEQAGMLYAQGLLTSDMSDVEVMHKVKDVALISKRFVPSRLDKIENQNLPPQEKIKMRLAEFGIMVEPVETKIGASVIQYQFKVSAGIRMALFAKHKGDIARAIEAKGEIRILAPIPGTALVGIEVPKEERTAVILTKSHFVPNTLSLPIGVDIHGESVKVHLDQMPHLLIAGTTGSGKSKLIATILTALIKQMTPESMELVLIDPKRVELTAFKKAKHLKSKKVLYEYEDVVRSLMTLTKTMEERYEELERTTKRDIGEYNKRVDETKINEKMPYIVVVIDEFADLIMRSKIEEKKTTSGSYRSRTKAWMYKELKSRANKNGEYFLKDDNGEMVKYHIYPSKDYDRDSLAEILESIDILDEMKSGNANVETLVVRLAQMGRAAGIHLIIATQSPRVDVITGLIKANFPTRIALTTSSHTESMIILGEPGAEKLNGKGDMIFMHPGSPNGKVRLQGFLTE